MNPFTYEIIPAEETQMLVVTNSDGAKAYYQHMWLGVNLGMQKTLSLYPNPANDIVQISGIKWDDIHEVEILDVSGKSIAVKSINEIDNVIFDLSDLSSGLYFMRITNNSGKVQSKKFLKK